MKYIYFILLFLIFQNTQLQSQETYTSGSTEYYTNQTYSTTGKPKVKRSAANKAKFLKSKGYSAVPPGYEVDHIIPLCEGGTDDPSNMQLLTIKAHAEKTAREKGSKSNSTYSGNSNYYSNSTSPNDTYEYSDGKKIYTSKSGSKYYININGNKTYIKSEKKDNTYQSPYSSSSIYPNSTSTSTCGARTSTGSACKRKVKDGGRCHSHS